MALLAFEDQNTSPMAYLLNAAQVCECASGPWVRACGCAGSHMGLPLVRGCFWKSVKALKRLLCVRLSC